ncbi:hypothetical protein, partial [Plesiomonas sp. ZOR0011]|uniref:hypothetical protein n=1 Tax=Plesiomonas sp. ZOR0011 TaxID=1339230 RepID=UPI001C450A44
FEMSIRCANFTLISNHCARKRAPLCPLIKGYQERLLINIFSVCKFCKTGVVELTLVRDVCCNLVIRTIVVC